jgi:hypothetical protein
MCVVYAILGVDLFGGRNSDSFSSFGAAMYTVMF